MYSEVIAMHGRRKSDEQIEIVAYIAKHKPVDETNINAVTETLEWLKAEQEKRKSARRKYGGKQNHNDKFIAGEIKRLSEIVKELRNEIH